MAPPPPPPPPKAAVAAPQARVTRPNAKPRGSNYQKALSARTLPTAPPPTESTSTGLQKAQSVRSIGPGGPVGLGVPPPPPPPKSKPTLAQRSASQRHFQISMEANSSGHSNSNSNNKSNSFRKANSKKNLSVEKAASPRNVTPPPPPPSTPTETENHVLVAEGVPLINEKDAQMLPMADESQREKEKNKNSKKKKKSTKEKPQETFEDEMQDHSVSEHDESLSVEEKAEQQEKQVRKTLCVAILSAFGIIAAMRFISWLLQKFNTDDVVPTGEDDIMNAGTNTGTAGATNSAAANTAVVQQMGVAASQSAAASSAAGSASAAAAAATATATVTAATGMTVASVATVTGVAGVVAYNAIMADPHPCHTFLEQMTVRPGHMVLHMQGIPENFLDVNQQRSSLEELFKETYNNVLGSCANHVGNHTDEDANLTATDNLPTDPYMYARYMENATLDGWRWFQRTDPESGDAIPYIETEWTASVGCDDTDGLGCSPVEPLFYVGDMPTGTNVSIARRLWVSGSFVDRSDGSRWLQQQDNSDVANFIAAFNSELKKLMETDSVDIYYGAALATNATKNAMEYSGSPYAQGEYIMGQAANGDTDDPNGGLPVCTLPNGNRIEVDMKQGQVMIDIKGIEDKAFWEDQRQTIAELFRSAYNDATKACDGEFHRVLQFASMDNLEVQEVQNQFLTSTIWTATVTCAGCSDHEPLFVSDAVTVDKNERRLSGIASQTLLASFANTFAEKVAELYQGSYTGVKAPSAYYAAALDETGAVVQGAGEKIPFVVVVEQEEPAYACESEVPPTEDEMAALPTARVEVFISHMSHEVDKTILGQVMQDVYNQVSGKCQGKFQRVVHQITIENINHGVKEDVLPYANANATAKLKCNDCNDLEPLFWDGEEGQRLLQEAQDLFARFQVMLTEEINLLLTDFESTPYSKDGTTFYPAGNAFAQDKEAEVFYAVTFDKEGQVFREVGEGLGTPAPTEPPLTAGDDVIVPVGTCSAHLVSADKDRGHSLSRDEFFVFVDAMYAELFDPLTWPKDIRNYDHLPSQVQEVFGQFQEGGLIAFGQTDQGSTSFSGEKLVRVEAICYYTSHAIDDAMAGLTASSTAVPTSAAPTAAPSEAPTETRIVTIYAQWKFGLTGELRNATEEELSDFASTTSEWMTENMVTYYANDTTNLTFVSQDLSIYETEFLPERTEEKNYNLAITTQSAFTFLGEQPSPKEVFDILDTFDLQGFIETELWITDPAITDRWIFDQIDKAVLASADVQA